MSLNSVKEEDRLTALKIIQKRYSFLFEDFWFILLQYLYFEKFVYRNTLYLEEKADYSKPLHLSYLSYIDEHNITSAKYGMVRHGTPILVDITWTWYVMKYFRFMTFNLILTALVGLGGLTTIPYCFKMIKQGKTKTKAFYILTFIQILLQTIFPFMRAGIVIMNLLLFNPSHIDNSHCILVGFQVYSLRKFKRFYKIYL